MKAAWVAVVVVAVALVAGSLALAWARRRFMLITVRGDSMMPTYRNGQRVLVRCGRFSVGDVVMIRSPAPQIYQVDWMVKRAVAMAGDAVPADLIEPAAAAVVPSGKLLVRSDASDGVDSRQLGLIDDRDVMGVVCAPGLNAESCPSSPKSR